MTACSADGPGVNNRSGGPTVADVYCHHLVVTKDGAINDYRRGASVSIDAATLECTSRLTVGDGSGDGGRRRRRRQNTALSIARAVKICLE